MKKQKWMILAGIFVIFLIGLLLSPIFSIQKIHISSMERYNDQELLQKANIEEGMHILAFQSGKAKKNFLSDPYFSSVQIKRIFPNQIEIQIEERKVYGYVPYMGTYLYIDSDGRVLESGGIANENLPIYSGLEFEQFVIGDFLKVENPSSFYAVVRMTQLLKKYEYDHNEISVDVSNPDDIHIYFNTIDVVLGSVKDCEEKIGVMDAALKQLPLTARGTLYLNEKKGVYRFQHLT